MAQEIKLKVKQEVDGEMVTKFPTYEIEKLNFFKFIGVTKLVKEIIATVKQDEELSDVFATMFLEEPETAGEAQEEMKKDKEFMGKLVGSFETLAVNLPEKALELLCALSNIDKNVLGNQDFDVILNVYDAVIEVNDIKELTERVKKSLALTKSAFKLKALVAEASQA